MNRLKISEVRAILIFLIINFIALGVIATLQTYYFQQAQDARQVQIDLINTIHMSDNRVDNKTDVLIDTHIKQDSEIHQRQAEIVMNQAKILDSMNILNQSVTNIEAQHERMFATLAK